MFKLMFVGAGKMGGAIAAGAVRSGKFSASDFVAYDVFPAAAEAFAKNTGVTCKTTDPAGLAAQAECIFLSVKPQNLAAAVETLKPGLKNQLVISIVAGVPIARIAELTGLQRIIRVMPNTPALVGYGAAVYAPAPDATGEDAKLAMELLSAVGSAEQLEEKYLDAVTGLSGSGPAYVFDFIQALSDGGVAMGLPRATATRLAAQTVLGSAQMVLSLGKHPGELRDQVTSPGGTTIRGLEKLAEKAFSGAVMAAVRAATERSEELGKGAH